MKIHGTAKGGALSKKDFGVAFGDSAVPFEEWIPEVSGTPNSPDWDSTKARGFQVTSGNPLIGNSLKTVAFKLWSIQNGGSDFDLVISLYSSSGAIRETSTNSFSAFSLSTTTPEFKTFNFDGDETINEDDVIALWHGSNHLLHVLQYSYPNTTDTTWTPVTIIPSANPVSVVKYPETVVT